MPYLEINKKSKINSTNTGIIAEMGSTTKQSNSTYENNDSISIRGVITSNTEGSKSIKQSVDFSISDTV